MLDGLGRTSKLGGQLDATSQIEQQQHTSLENEVNVDATLGDETNQITSTAALAGMPAQTNTACRRTEYKRGKEILEKVGQRTDTAICGLGNPGRV